MPKEKGPKGITRRQFLKGITALGTSALLSSCGVEEEPVSQKPTETLRPAETTPPTKVPTQESSPIPEPTLTPEPTSTPEVVSISGIILTEEYLKNAFAGIGGEEVIANGQEKVSMVQFGQEYVSQSWGEEIDFTELSEDPVASLRYLVSLGAYQGQEGVYSPGKQGEEVIFPQLATLSLARLALKSVPSEMEPKEQDYREQISPLNLTLRPQTQMTVIGLLNEPRPGVEVTVDKEAPGGEPNYALVSFTDYLRVSEEGVPRHYLALLPTHFPADPENKNTLSLQNLLEANGYQYDSQSKEITVVGQDNQKIVLGLNRIEGEELTKDLRQATGLAFIDQMKGEPIKNPLVPYYEEMPAIWEIKEETDEDGTISLLLQGQNEKGEMVAVAKASYDQEKEAWGWEKLVATAETTLEDTSSLLLELDSGIISSLTKISKEIYDIKYLKPYKNRADELITGMGITDPYLVELYREFFNTEWVHPSWPEVEYHGLGIYTLTEQGKKPYLHSAVGLLYGFVPIENIPQQVIEAEKNASNTLPRPYYLILQIEPGKDLTPENNPNAFVALKMGAHIYGGKYDASGFVLRKAKDSKLESFVVERITSQEPRKTSRGPDAWTLEELSSAFGLRKNSLIFVTGMARTPGEASVSWFSIIVPEFPSEEVKKQYNFFLTD